MSVLEFWRRLGERRAMSKDIERDLARAALWAIRRYRGGTPDRVCEQRLWRARGTCTEFSSATNIRSSVENLVPHRKTRTHVAIRACGTVMRISSDISPTSVFQLRVSDRCIN